MSLTTWHPPPITHIGFPSHTSNSEYGRWSSMPNSHYSPITVTTPTSSPWLHRKSYSSQSENPDSDIFSSTGTLAYNNNRQPDVALNDRSSSYPFASELRKSLLTGNNSNNRKNDVKTILYRYNDPTSLNSNNKISTSTYTPELYSSNENNAPSYKTNFTATAKSTASPWNQNKYSVNGTSISGSEPQKEPPTVSSSPSWRSVKVSTSPSLSASTYVTEPTPTRGYELYSELSNNNSNSSSSSSRPAATVSTTVYASSPGTNRNLSLQRSNSFHGPASSSSNNSIDSKVIHYSPVSSRTVRDKLDSWGNDRQNASAVNSITPYTSSRESLQNGHSHITYRSASEPRELLNSSPSSSLRHDSYHGSLKPHTYESYNQGLGLSRQNTAVTNGYGTLEKSTANLQQKLDELNMGDNNSVSSSSSLATKLRNPDSPRSVLVSLSPRTSRKPLPVDWDRYLYGDRSTTAPSPSSSQTNGNVGGDIFNREQRFRSAPSRKPKSILKKKSAYETVSGAENWRNYFQDSEYTGYGLYRQNTMPSMRQPSRAPLPQLTRKPSGRRVHFAV